MRSRKLLRLELFYFQTPERHFASARSKT